MTVDQPPGAHLFRTPPMSHPRHRGARPEHRRGNAGKNVGYSASCVRQPTHRATAARTATPSEPEWRFGARAAVMVRLVVLMIVHGRRRRLSGRYIRVYTRARRRLDPCASCHGSSPDNRVPASAMSVMSDRWIRHMRNESGHDRTVRRGRKRAGNHPVTACPATATTPVSRTTSKFSPTSIPR